MMLICVSLASLNLFLSLCAFSNEKEKESVWVGCETHKHGQHICFSLVELLTSTRGAQLTFHLSSWSSSSSSHSTAMQRRLVRSSHLSPSYTKHIKHSSNLQQPAHIQLCHHVSQKHGLYVSVSLKPQNIVSVTLYRLY